MRALGEYGVLRFPDQRLDAAALRDFSLALRLARKAPSPAQFAEPGMPEVGILSNIVENGQPIGLADAGQDWHTDMSYNATIGFLERALRGEGAAPRRPGARRDRFADMGAAYDELPAGPRRRAWTDATATHDFNKFWEMMRTRPGSERAAADDGAARKRPPVDRIPLFMTHPITGRKVLYCNPGYADAHQRAGPGRERPRAGVAVRAPAAAAIPLRSHAGRKAMC